MAPPEERSKAVLHLMHQLGTNSERKTSCALSHGVSAGSAASQHVDHHDGNFGDQAFRRRLADPRPRQAERLLETGAESS